VTHSPFMVRAASLVLACFVLGGAAVAQAQLPHDYEWGSDEWNGLSAFQALALDRGVNLTHLEKLDYSALEPARPLVILYPTTPLNAEAIQEFVADGGRIFLADDFGSSDQLLSTLSEPIVRVVSPPEAASTRLNGNPNLPVIRTPGRHPLLEGGVERLIANHPAGFQSALPAVAYFDDARLGFVYDLTIGDGKLVVVGDSSLLINLMIDMGDNGQFVGNALQMLCGDTPYCSADVLIGEFDAVGHYGEPGEASDPSVEVQEMMEKLNKAAQQLLSWIPDRRLMRVMSLLLLVGMLLLGLAIFPFYGPRFLSIRFRPPARLLPRSEFERNLLEFSRGQNTNYVLPIAILRDEFERLFLRELYGEVGAPDNEARYRPKVVEQTSSLYADRVSLDSKLDWKQRKRQAFVLMTAFSKIPARSQLFINPGQRWSERDLSKLYEDSQEILTALNVKEEYEQRIRRTT